MGKCFNIFYPPSAKYLFFHWPDCGYWKLKPSCLCTFPLTFSRRWMNQIHSQRALAVMMLLGNKSNITLASMYFHRNVFISYDPSLNQEFITFGSFIGCSWFHFWVLFTWCFILQFYFNVVVVLSYALAIGSAKQSQLWSIADSCCKTRGDCRWYKIY